ncbi:MAG: hypothetical protein IKI03_06415 [Clostridia bacterium]|nr:hypothetical protein [Clostridia bacterium]
MEDRRTAFGKTNGSSKEEYIALEIDVISFDERDIITDSECSTYGEGVDED